MATKKAKATKPLRKQFALWTVFLLKKDFSTPDKYLSSTANKPAPSQHLVTIPGAQSAILYSKDIPETTPAWVKQFNGIASPPIKARTKSASAVLVIATTKRTYAVAFGFGRAILDSDAWEEEFGLKVVLNGVDEEGIKEIQLSAFDALLQSKQAQSVRNARIDEFGLDVEQDVIRSMTGIPSDPTLGRNFGGRDSLRVSTEVKLPGLPEFLDRLLLDYERTDYLKTFSWVGRMKEVRNKELRDKLDKGMLDKLISKDLERLWIAPPTYQDWQAGRFFKIPKIEELQDDLRLQDILDEWEQEGELPDLTVNLLRSRKILVLNDSDQELEHYPIYKAIYCEIDIAKETYLLNNAIWYQIEGDYLSEVNDAIKNFPKSTLNLPSYDDLSEEDYNKRVCQAIPAICLMDQKFIELKARGYTKVEFCDLMTSSKELVHVKRYSGSSTLSHLFAQGIVPAELFLNVPEFRQKVDDKLPVSHKLADPKADINPKDYEVVYGIISKSKKEVNLPFFSKVMLRNARTVLENLNYRVSICQISNIYSPPKKATGKN